MLHLWGQAGEPSDPAERRPSAAAWRATGAFACLALGYVAALALWRRGVVLPGVAWLGAGLLALIPAVWASRPRATRAGLVVAALLLGAGHFTGRILETPADGVAGVLALPLMPGEGRIAELEGVVLNDPEERRPAGALAHHMPLGSGSSFDLAVSRVLDADSGRRASGRVRVITRGGPPPVRAGDRVTITGVAHAIAPPLNPGEPDARLWARQDGREVTLIVQSADLIEPATGSVSPRAQVRSGWLRARATLRARALRSLDGAGGDGGAVLGALLLGESDADSQDVRAVFARQGLAHVLAISGFHLAVMAGAALFAVRLTGDRGRLEPLLVAALVVLYVLLLPARAPILRAAAMVLAWLGAESLGRRYDRRALLAWVAVGVLLVRPMDLFGLGFQLTFGITGALVWLGGAAHARLFPPRLTFRRHEPPDALEARWWGAGAARLVSASVLCWLVATPLVAHTVGIVSPGAVLSTLVVVPVVTVLLWAGYVTMVVGLSWPGAAPALAGVLGLVASAVLGVVTLADSVPLSAVYVPRLSLALTCALTALAAWWIARASPRRALPWVLTGLCGAWLAAEVSLAGRLRPSAALRVDTLAVGDGTCHLVRSGRGALLWDCGSLNPSVGVRTIPRACRELGAWRVREVLITHANFDHYSGLLDCADALGVRRVTVGEAFAARAGANPRGGPAELLAGLRRRGIEVRVLAAGDTIRVGAADLRLLSPEPGRAFVADNDNSLIALASVPVGDGERRVLLCGDAQREALASIMPPGADLAADVLELPHHGSVHATALDFVSLVDPSVVMQSTGPSRVLDIGWNAHRQGREWYTTALDGAAWVELRRDGSIVTGSRRRR